MSPPTDFRQTARRATLREEMPSPFTMRDGRLNIADWDTFKIQLADNLMNRTGLMYEIRNFQRLEQRGVPLVGDEIRIACVSSPIAIGMRGQDGTFDLRETSYRDECTLAQAEHVKVFEDWEDKRLRELSFALGDDAKNPPHVICFGEFAYPPVWRAGRPGWEPAGIRDAILKRNKFEQQIVARLADVAWQPFVHLGSYHCPMTLYNVGVTYPWGKSLESHECTVAREPREDQDKSPPETEYVTAPVLHRKRFPARRRGENTRVPSSRDFDIYKLPIGRVANLICSDIVDINQFLSLARYNNANAEDPIDIVLVPSFNMSDSFNDMCRQLSYLANTVVVVCNAHQPKFPKSQIYACGLGYEELKKEIDGISVQLVEQEVETPLRHPDRRESLVTTFRLRKAGIGALRQLIKHRRKKTGSPGDAEKRSL
jgi:hypothetical protein